MGCGSKSIWLIFKIEMLNYQSKVNLDIKKLLDEIIHILHAFSTGYQKPTPGNFGTLKPIYVSRFYEQQVPKHAFLLERRNYGMAWTQSLNL